jgi:serine/threonine protein kinase
MRTLGRGAFGVVWLAERRSSLLTTQVALKLPFDAGADLDAIRDEAQVWLKASGHPNVAPVIDAEVYDGQVVIASEFVAGGSLLEWLVQHDGKAPSIEEAVKLIAGILAGLEILHENDLIHRDLKPGNILLQRGIPRLTDFGLTRVLKPSGHTSTLAGTPGYMAPEAFRGEYSYASDLWAAGMLLHELVTGSLTLSSIGLLFSAARHHQ